MKITTIETRLTKDTEFFEFPDDIRLYVEEIYLSTGKLVSTVFEYSQDELVKTRIYEFRSKEDLMDFRSDVFLNQLRIEKSEYEEKNSITVRFFNSD